MKQNKLTKVQKAVVATIHYFGDGSQRRAASALGVHESTLSGWLNGHYNVSEDLANMIEERTRGKIKATSLRPKRIRA